MRGRFITLEGADGAGKTTQLTHVVASIEEAGFEVVQTREPGGTELGERIRGLVKNADYKIGADAETLLIFAARAQHIEEVIEPSLARGAWVVSDRFTDATYAYQGAGRGLGFERIAILEQWTQAGLRPDLTLFFDLTPAQSKLRAIERSRQLQAPVDRFEQEQLEFKQRLYNGYLMLCRDNPARIKRIHASDSVSNVARRTRAAIAEFIRLHLAAVELN